MESKSILSMQWMEYCHILYKDNKGIIVDPGFNVEKILEELKGLKLKSLDIIITHCHFDHFQSVNEVLELFPDANIYVHQASIPVLDHGYEWYMHQFGERIDFKKDPIFFEKEMNVQGFKLKTHWTPGHTVESVLIEVVGEKAIIVGDTFFRTTIGRTDYFSANQYYLEETLKFVKTFDKDLTVFQGHDVPFKLEDAFKENPFFIEDQQNYITCRKEDVKDLNKFSIDSTLESKLKDDKDFNAFKKVQQFLMVIKEKHDNVVAVPTQFYTEGFNWNKILFEAFKFGNLEDIKMLTKRKINYDHYIDFMMFTLMAELRLYNVDVSIKDIETWAKLYKKTK